MSDIEINFWRCILVIFLSVVGITLYFLWKAPVSYFTKVKKPAYLQTIGLHWVYLFAILGLAYLLTLIMTGIKF